MKTSIHKAIKQSGNALRKFNFENKSQYTLWLSQCYYFVRHSTPMLAVSAGLSVDNPSYHQRCIDHLSEEKGHEKLLLNDLKALGFKPSDFPELPETQALYQTQYYWIEHKSPISFMGYVFLLEGLAVDVGAELMDRVKGHPGHGFIKVHTHHDVDHLEKAFNMFDALPEAEQKSILANCIFASKLYQTMTNAISEFGSVLDSVKSQGGKNPDNLIATL